MTSLSSLHGITIAVFALLRALMFLAAGVVVLAYGRGRGALPGTGLLIIAVAGIVAWIGPGLLGLLGPLGPTAYLILDTVTDLLLATGWVLIIVGLFRRRAAAVPAPPGPPAAPPRGFS